MHPVNDKLKVAVETNEFGFGDKTGIEKGIVIEIPDTMLYFGFHSFAFDISLAEDETLKAVKKFYENLKGKLVFWESLQDRGRRFKVNGKEFVFLNMSDIIAYSDDKDINVEIVDQTGQAGSFNLS